MRAGAGILICCVACALAGCGTSASDQVKAKISQFVKAADAKDYTALCNQVLAPSLVDRLASAGLSCREAMQVAFQGVENPALSVGKVTVSGSKASAITLSTARNQQASVDTIELVKTDHGWRVSSLASPLTSSQIK
jgi:hypothetical protein